MHDCPQPRHDSSLTLTLTRYSILAIRLLQFRNIISYIPTRVACPECRQERAYKGAVSLKELGFLIKDRFPKEYAERRNEERETRRNMSLRPTEPNDSGRPVYPFDILHF